LLDKKLAEGGNVCESSSASPDARRGVHAQRCFGSLLEGKRFFFGPGALSYYADLALNNVLTVMDETVFDPETYLAAKFPNIMDPVEAHPAVAAYIRSGRRRTAFVPYRSSGGSGGGACGAERRCAVAPRGCISRAGPHLLLGVCVCAGRELAVRSR
jgi:hypothetical protein